MVKCTDKESTHLKCEQIHKILNIALQNHE